MNNKEAIAKAVQEEQQRIIELIEESGEEVPRVLETYFLGQSPSIAKYQEEVEQE